ncbi:hypothetical protein ACOMHN_018216 [Nucella lapillus]
MARMNDFSFQGEQTSPFSAANTTRTVSVPEGCVLKPASAAVPWKNEDNLIPKQVEVMFNVISFGVCLPLCFLVSLCCNTLNMVVFYKHGLKERINMLLFSLALLDLLSVSSIYGYFSDFLYIFLVGRGGEIRPVEAFFFNNYIIGLVGAGAASQVVSSLIALERCLCITHPLLVKNLMSTQKTAIVLWFFLLWVISGVFVDTMRITVGCVFDASNNTTSLQWFPSQLFLQNQGGLYVFISLFYGTVLPSSCVTCVTVCTVIIVVKMRKLSSWRETVSSASDSLTSRDLALTRMIVGTSVLFIVCILPAAVARIPTMLVPDLRMGGRYENLFALLASTFYLTTVLNSSFNFFVYFAYGTKFRQTVLQLFISRDYGQKTQKEPAQ